MEELQDVLRERRPGEPLPSLLQPPVPGRVREVARGSCVQAPVLRPLGLLDQCHLPKRARRHLPLEVPEEVLRERPEVRRRVVRLPEPPMQVRRDDPPVRPVPVVLLRVERQRLVLQHPERAVDPAPELYVVLEVPGDVAGIAGEGGESLEGREGDSHRGFLIPAIPPSGLCLVIGSTHDVTPDLNATFQHSGQSSWICRALRLIPPWSQYTLSRLTLKRHLLHSKSPYDDRYSNWRPVSLRDCHWRSAPRTSRS